MLVLHVHVAQVRGDLHCCAAMQLLPCVTPPLKLRRVHAKPLRNVTILKVKMQDAGRTPGVRVDVRHHAADVAVPVGDENASEGHGRKA